MSDSASEAKLKEIFAKDAIRDCLNRYSRAIDRRDFGLLKTVFWPEAIDEHGAFNGPVSEFWAWAAERTVTWDRTMHSLGQIIIDVRGDEAGVETYFTAYHKKPKPDGSWFDEFVAGRYIDRMSCRGGEWRIQHRIVAYDWFRHLADSTEFDNSPFGTAQRGCRDETDPIYRLLSGIIAPRSSSK